MLISIALMMKISKAYGCVHIYGNGEGGAKQRILIALLACAGLSVSIYIYTYISIHTYAYVYMHIHTYTSKTPEGSKPHLIQSGKNA